MTAEVLESRIESVTVFREEALVRRVAEISAGPGGYPAEVRLTDLPLCLDDTSVRIRVEAADGEAPPVAPDVRVSLDVSRLAEDDRPPAESPDLTAARREERRLAALLESESILQDGLRSLDVPRRRKGKQKDRPDGSPTNPRLALLDFRTEKVRESVERVRDLTERHRDARETLRRLEEDDRAGSTDRHSREHELRKCAVVRLETDEATADRARLVLEYLVPGGGWAPTYVARFDRGASRVALELRAIVAQRTGEDWTDVKLTLSTAEALRFTELPVPTSLRIGRRQSPHLPIGWREPTSGAETLYGDYDRAFPAEPPDPPEFEDTALEMASGAPSDVLEDLREAGSIFEEAEVAELGMPMVAMAAPAPRARRASRAKFTPPAPDAEPEPFEELAPGLPGADLLAYGHLVMPGPLDPGRGRLRVVTRHETYVEVLTRTTVVVDLEEAQDGARLAATDVRHRPAQPGCVRPERGRFAHVYRASSTVSIPSDGADHGVPLRTDSSDASLRYVTVPREAQDAFRVASFRNPLGAPLLTGPVDLYLDGAYQMTGELEHVPAGAEVELGLGVEPGIKVARNTDYAEESRGLVKGALDLRHDIDVEIVSHLPAAALVEVRERVPVVTEGEENLVVEVIETEPGWEAYDPPGEKLEGGHRWVRPVEPGESANFRAVYVIRIPSKSELVGGNRREVSS